VVPTSVPSATRPAGLCIGVGHVVVYGNPAFHAQFGSRSLGLPARETLIDLPPAAFELLDAVYARGRPFARWIERGHEVWRMTAIPRRDPSTEEVYGVAFHLRASSDVPVINSTHDSSSTQGRDGAGDS
jgi:hypothetical protein